MNQHGKPKRKSRGGGWLAFITVLAIAAVCAMAIENRPTAATPGRRDGALQLDGCRRQERGENDAAITTEQPTESSSPPPSLDTDSAWMLTLVSAVSPLPEGFMPPLKTLANGLQFDGRAIDQLNAMLSAARQQGLSPVVCSAYRTIEKQRSLFDSKVSALRASGLDPGQADSEARKHVAYPGTSEHNLGLAADIVSLSYQHLDDKQADTPEAQWLHEHCAAYGFIPRYPKGKEELTGIVYEPWHFRYVGVQAAAAIMEGGLCLEEYLVVPS